jgi:hypothetical protein
MLARGQQTTECARSLVRVKERQTVLAQGKGAKISGWEITCVIDGRAFPFDWLGVFDLRRGKSLCSSLQNVLHAC